MPNRCYVIGTIAVDFERGILSHRLNEYPFTPLGAVAQELIVAGGLEPILADAIATRHLDADVAAGR
jgi:hypothetical protein